LDWSAPARPLTRATWWWFPVPAPTRPQSPSSCPDRFDPLQPPFPSLSPPFPPLSAVLLRAARRLELLCPSRRGWSDGGAELLVPRDPVGGRELRPLLLRYGVLGLFSLLGDALRGQLLWNSSWVGVFALIHPLGINRDGIRTV
jgi:hypothetical protein